MSMIIIPPGEGTTIPRRAQADWIVPSAQVRAHRHPAVQRAAQELYDQAHAAGEPVDWDGGIEIQIQPRPGRISWLKDRLFSRS